MAPDDGTHLPNAQRMIGSAIRRFRDEDGATLEQLARRAGISYQYLCGIETGKENFSIGIFEKICFALDRSPATVVMAAYEGAEAL
jgi:transcriptional regulator with XRE-family HTH domain